MLLPLRDTVTALAVAAVVTKSMFFSVTPFVLLVPIVSGATVLEIMT